MDKKRVTCIAATTSRDFHEVADNNNKDCFSNDNLKKMQRDISIKNIPILIGFDADKIIGYVISSEVTSKGLVITAEIKDYILPAYIVPGFNVTDADYDADADTFKYKDIELQSMGLTYHPSEVHVTLFEEIEW